MSHGLYIYIYTNNYVPSALIKTVTKNASKRSVMSCLYIHVYALIIYYYIESMPSELRYTGPHQPSTAAIRRDLLFFSFFPCCLRFSHFAFALVADDFKDLERQNQEVYSSGALVGRHLTWRHNLSPHNTSPRLNSDP